MTIIIFLTCMFLFPCHAQDPYIREMDLAGYWRFKASDNMDYARIEYNDSHWGKIPVPAAWEDHNFPEHDGFAWYRKEVMIPKKLAGKTLYMHYKADDVDAFFFNGRALYSVGDFPPKYRSEYNRDRWYCIAPSLIHFGKKNLIAIRVYDGQKLGGIRNCHVGFYSRTVPELIIDLSGIWHFKIGHQDGNAAPALNCSDWEERIVPANWEAAEGLPLDGHAWYRKITGIPAKYKARQLILALGKIDDYDEVFFNGTHIGCGGIIRHRVDRRFVRTGWKDERFYYIPAHMVRWGRENVIAVHVFDITYNGGIYDGPVGIMTEDALTDYREQIDKEKALWEN